MQIKIKNNYQTKSIRLEKQQQNERKKHYNKKNQLKKTCDSQKHSIPKYFNRTSKTHFSRFVFFKKKIIKLLRSLQTKIKMS